MYAHGWYLVAFEKDLTKEITSATIGKTRLILVRKADGITAYSADCPHRGAHLAHGGRLDGNAIICPFHSYRVGLNKSSRHGFGVQQYETLVVGGLVFVRLSDAFENGLTDFMTQLAENHVIIPGFETQVKTPPAMVIENGFDNRHFPAVHGVRNDPQFTVRSGETGTLIVESEFEIPTSMWVGNRQQEKTIKVPYRATTFSPGLITVQLSGDANYAVITGATATPEGDAVVRLSLALPVAVHGKEPDTRFYQYILTYSRQGIEDDRVMWENLAVPFTSKFTAQDAAVLAFHEFCRHYQAGVEA